MHANHLTEFHFSKKTLAEYLDKSIRWVDYQLTGTNPPPGFKFGKRWTFRKSEIDAWMESFRAGSDLDQIAAEAVREELE